MFNEHQTMSVMYIKYSNSSIFCTLVLTVLTTRRFVNLLIKKKWDRFFEDLHGRGWGALYYINNLNEKLDYFSNNISSLFDIHHIRCLE